MSGDPNPGIFDRISLLVGEDAMDLFAKTKVILFGTGGVGSWCAEGLVRSGITHLTIVDGDRVAASNVNRQAMATSRNIGEVKVEAMKSRLLEINPQAEIETVFGTYSDENWETFGLDRYDYIIDAIDTLHAKASLILRASAAPGTFFSSMGAALKLNPTGVRVAEFWDVRGCPLGATLRKKFRRENTLPARKFLCVYDEEVIPRSPDASANGSAVTITGLFGFTLAGLVIRDLYNKTRI
jgi:tRNA A37 threonylcarbamoyladenosine dehydratase